MQRADQRVDAWRNKLAEFDWQQFKPVTPQNAIRLLEEAVRLRQVAYAPYSNFSVGAALLCPDGQIFSGCNIENASYGATVCAERVAAFNAVSQARREFLALAVIGEGHRPLPPCGMCRQVLAEFNPRLPVFMANMIGDLDLRNLTELLPLAFDVESLRQ